MFNFQYSRFVLQQPFDAVERDPELYFGFAQSKPLRASGKPQAATRAAQRSAASQSRSRTARSAFSLVEMLVVIAIIIILLGIGLAVSTAVISKGEQQKTRVTLTNAAAVLDQYLTLTGQSAGDVFSGTTNGVSELFSKASGVKRMEPMFNGFDTRALKKSNGGWGLYDGWDNAIHLKWADGKDPSGGTLPDIGRPYFASMGQDSDWGEVDSSNEAKAEAEANNLYSYQLYE